MTWTLFLQLCLLVVLVGAVFVAMIEAAKR